MNKTNLGTPFPRKVILSLTEKLRNVKASRNTSFIHFCDIPLDHHNWLEEKISSKQWVFYKLKA